MTLGLIPSDVFLTGQNALVVILALVATGLSAFISYHAYRGYRRNGSRPMLFLAIGFAFITFVPFFVDIVFYAVVGRLYSARTASVILPSVKYGIQIVGLSFVLYSLYGRRSDHSRLQSDRVNE
jgi:hypothetical protein